MSNENAGNYGKRFWVVRTPAETVMAHADRVMVQSGCLLLLGKFQHESRSAEFNAEQEEQIMLSFAHGQWTSVWAASVWDGSPVAVDAWAGPTSSKSMIEDLED